MKADKQPTDDLVEEMRKLQEGVGAANQKLAQVTEYLGAATRDLKDAAKDAEEPTAAEPASNDAPGPK